MPNWLGGPEILILVLVLVLLFGAKKLPDTARGLGRSLRIFKSEIKASQDDDGNSPPQEIQAAPGEVSSPQPNVAPPATEPTTPDSKPSDR